MTTPSRKLNKFFQTVILKLREKKNYYTSSKRIKLFPRVKYKRQRKQIELKTFFNFITEIYIMFQFYNKKKNNKTIRCCCPMSRSKMINKEVKKFRYEIKYLIFLYISLIHIIYLHILSFDLVSNFPEQFDMPGSLSSVGVGTYYVLHRDSNKIVQYMFCSRVALHN